jgi:hypothetical protein
VTNKKIPAVTVALGVFAAAGCATNGLPLLGTAISRQALSTTPPAAGLIDPSSVDTSDPHAVALAAVLTTHRWDTRTDSSPTDAARRAGQWLTPDLGVTVAVTGQRANGDWLELQNHRGYSEVTAAIADEYGQPADTDTTAYVQVSYTVTLVAADGWTRTLRPDVARVRLTRSNSSPEAVWLISGFLG